MKAYLEPDEVERLEAAATCYRDKLLVRTLFWGSMRVSEAIGINVEDIDFDGRTVTITHEKVRLRLHCPDCNTRLSKSAKFCPGCGQEVPEPLKKQQETRRVRTIPLDATTLELFQYFIQRSKHIQRDGGKGPIFRIERHTAYKIIRGCAERAGLGKLVNPETGREHNVSPHRLRDASATMLAKADGSTDGLRMLQERLGHDDIGTTMRYRKVGGQEQREWFDKLTGNSEESAVP